MTSGVPHHPDDIEALAAEHAAALERLARGPSMADDIRSAGHLPIPGCHCAACEPQGNPFLGGTMRMILCATCGNKRCPHATDHRNACTGSNEPGQPGSAYA